MERTRPPARSPSPEPDQAERLQSAGIKRAREQVPHEHRHDHFETADSAVKRPRLDQSPPRIRSPSPPKVTLSEPIPRPEIKLEEIQLKRSPSPPKLTASEPIPRPEIKLEDTIKPFEIESEQFFNLRKLITIGLLDPSQREAALKSLVDQVQTLGRIPVRNDGASLLHVLSELPRRWEDIKETDNFLARVARELLDIDNAVNERDQRGATPLICAAAEGLPCLARMFVSYGAEFTKDIRDNDGKTTVQHWLDSPNPNIDVFKAFLESPIFKFTTLESLFSIDDFSKRPQLFDNQKLQDAFMRLVQTSRSALGSSEFLGFASLENAGRLVSKRAPLLDRMLDEQIKLNLEKEREFESFAEYETFSHSLLERAAELGVRDTFMKLLDAGSRIRHSLPEDDEGYLPPLLYAAMGGDVQIIRTLISKGCPVDDVGNNPELGTPLVLSVALGKQHAARELIAAGADIMAKDGLEYGLLHSAVLAGRKEMIQWALTLRTREGQPLDIEARNNTDETPLLTAVRCGNLETVQALIEAGADISAKDGAGGNIFHTAVLYHPEMVSELARLLREKGKLNELHTLIEEANTEGDTPLLHSLRHETLTLEAAKSLLALGASLLKHDREGRNVFHLACTNHKMIRFLAAHLRNIGQSHELQKLVNAAARPGYISTAFVQTGSRALDQIIESHLQVLTPLQLMLMRQEGVHTRDAFSAFNALIEAGAKIDHSGTDARNPLWTAVATGRADVISALIAAGANPDVLDEEGLGLLHLAAIKRKSEAIRALPGNLINSGRSNPVRNSPKAIQLTPLHLAIKAVLNAPILGNFEQERTDTIKALLDKGAQIVPDTEAMIGTIALAKVLRQESVVKLLEEYARRR